MSISDDKKDLRSAIRIAMQGITPEDQFRMDMMMHRNLLRQPWLHEADLILCYCSTKAEPDTHWLIGWAFDNGKQIALPVCTAQGEMHFYMIRSMAELRRGKYGILEPTGREEAVITEKTLCIVPAVAFTEDGRRLGKGGGYYDRFLEANPKLRTIGLTYHRLLQEDIPCEPHDKGVDTVVTD